ncbi:MAG: aldehyde dehydrogenase family protein [Verrucomicrobiota bacterium]|nr:aldehyde dehydrogenase family protein [Verrucomicrobiota bacterium]
MPKRLSVLKTYKLYIGGKFARGESGRVEPAHSPGGQRLLANYCVASRKDFRDAVVAARKAQPGWAGATAYLRGQILYRAAEIGEQRLEELTSELQRAGGRQAGKEAALTVDRLVHYAGWTDKYGPLFSTVNPVATPHFNFTLPEPTGVVVIVCPDLPPLLAFISLLAPVILSGNTAVVLASETAPLPALTFAEIVATSDLPGGVVNVLAGRRSELAPHLASHMDVNAIVDGTDDAALGRVLAAGGAMNVKRYARHALPLPEWFTSKAENPYWILDTVELKTAWHPKGF